MQAPLDPILLGALAAQLDEFLNGEKGKQILKKMERNEVVYAVTAGGDESTGTVFLYCLTHLGLYEYRSTLDSPDSRRGTRMGARQFLEAIARHTDATDELSLGKIVESCRERSMLAADRQLPSLADDIH